MKRRIIYVLLILAFHFSSITGNSQGWIITNDDNSVTYIGDGWIKTYSGDMDEIPITSMYNPGSNLIIMINENDMTFAKGSTEDFCNAMKSMREDMNKQMPAEQQKMMDQMIAQERAKPAPKVTVQKGAKDNIAGFSATKYSILVDDELFKEIWISNDPDLENIIQVVNTTAEMTWKTVNCSVPDEVFLKNSPEFSKEYRDLEHTGLELKSVSYEYGVAEPESEVVSIERESFDDEFTVPEEYSEVSLKELIMSMSGM